MRRLLIALVCYSFQLGIQVSALAQCTGTAFHVLPAFPVVQEPTAAAYGDFNNDRIKDIAISSNHSNAVGILLGRPSGGFGPIRLIPVQLGPLSIVVGNFNQDSNQDLAVINFLGGSGPGGSVSVLMGNGQGDFTLRAHLPTGPKPISLAPLDVNNDRNLDLAVVSYAANEVLILKGDGAGNFPTSIVIPTNDMPRQIEVGHFNGDNKIDLAVLHDSSPSIIVFLANVLGNFDRQSPGFDAGRKPAFMRAVFFNADVIPDLLVTNLMGSDISIITGNGDGTFGPPANFRTGKGPFELAFADFTRDDKPDLAVANMISNNVSLLAGDGRGAFVPHSAVSTTERPIALIATDFNNDFDQDLLVISHKPLGFGLAGTGVIMLNTCRVPDLALSMTPGTFTFAAGRTEYYRFSIINKGTDTTFGAITLTDQLSPGLTFKEATGKGWTCSATGSTVTCTISESLRPNATASVLTMTVDVTQAAVPTVVNTATVTYSDEVIRDNNSVRVEVAVLPSSDLGVTYNSFPTTVNVGQNIVYQLTVRNTGPSPAVDVALLDVLPENLEFISANPSTGSCSGTMNIRCNLGNIPLGGSAQITITARARTPGTADNAVVVRGGNVDLNSSNNSKTATTTINPPPSP